MMLEEQCIRTLVRTVCIRRTTPASDRHLSAQLIKEARLALPMAKQTLVIRAQPSGALLCAMFFR